MKLHRLKAGLVITVAIFTFVITGLQLGLTPNSGKKLNNQESLFRYQLNSIEYRLRDEIGKAKRILRTDTNLLVREKVILQRQHIKSMLDYAEQYQEVLRVTDEYIPASLDVYGESIKAWESLNKEGNRIDKKALKALKNNLTKFQVWMIDYVKTKKNNEQTIAGLVTFLSMHKTSALTDKQKTDISIQQMEAIIGSPATIGQINKELDKLLLPNNIVKLTEKMLSQYGKLVTAHNKNREKESEFKQWLISILLILVSIMTILVGIVEYMIARKSDLDTPPADDELEEMEFLDTSSAEVINIVDSVELNRTT